MERGKGESNGGREKQRERDRGRRIERGTEGERERGG